MYVIACRNDCIHFFDILQYMKTSIIHDGYFYKFGSTKSKILNLIKDIAVFIILYMKRPQ